MVKALSFKGDKKAKKRKRVDTTREDQDDGETADLQPSSSSKTNKLIKLSEEDAAAVENDDSWVSAEAASDVSGPIMFVLPSEPPSALACDPAGKVFALPVENAIDDNPATAEPHDVRQVWVANKVAGTEMFRFKGHHGK
jgi:protein FRG1